MLKPQKVFEKLSFPRLFGSAKNPYDLAHEKSINPETRNDYFRQLAQQVKWDRFPSRIFNEENYPLNTWFPDGLINITTNCLDRHADADPNRKAIIYESPLADMSYSLTYQELQEKVSLLAGVLKKHGVGVGDRVVIYMPMIPAGFASMLACARVGAIHSVIFGGFAAKELASRIKDCQPKAILAASCGLEPGRLVDYKRILDEAKRIAGRENDLPTIIKQRPVHKASTWNSKQDFDMDEELASVKRESAVPVPSTHPLYILYTSGTTGVPKGVYRDQGGTTVMLNAVLDQQCNMNAGDVFFSGSDIGWVVGHTFSVYGPLIRGCTTVVYEGKPTGTPDCMQYWRMTEKYGINGIYTAPTAIRAIRKEDSHGELAKEFNLSSLKTFNMAGERLDLHTFKWLEDILPKSCLLNDQYWQTESGSPISSNYLNLHKFKPKGGSATKPAPGFNVKVLDQEGNELPNRKDGDVSIKLPLPPSFMRGLWGNDQAYIDKYLSTHEGYYTTGDHGFIDEEGYLHIMSRLDDVINTAGHRLSTSQLEESIMGHKAASEVAVVGAIDDLKGEIPVGLVVLKSGITEDHEKLENEMIRKVREDIGPVASFKRCFIVDKLPKTRSGKVLRGVIKKMLDGHQYKVPGTIEDMSVISSLHKFVNSHGFGLSNPHEIEYEEDVVKP